MKFYSGGAKGADSIWESLLKEKGHDVKVYRPEDISALSSEELSLVNKQYNEVVKILGRKTIPISQYAGRLVRRDMLQVKNASCVFAIGHLGDNGLIDGGTGYATTRAIIIGIDVYLFNQDTLHWMKYINNKFTNCDEPELINHSCVVGSRNITPEGIEAIKRIVNKI